MISKSLRERLTYTAMSVFVAWHTAAMLFAPAPDNSVIAIALRPVFQPYLSLFRLDNTWDFSAPFSKMRPGRAIPSRRPES